MLFSSMIFLWCFLPIIFCLYRIVNEKYRNIVLLIASIIFYAWGEPRFIFLMLFSIILNYWFGMLIEEENEKNRRQLWLIICIILNLGLLSYFKYFNFIVENINLIIGGSINTRTIILPIGISFYTFQALSYVVDVYRSKKNKGTLHAQRNIFNLGLYICIFPQLIAGPIVKYYDVEQQIYKREINTIRTAYGMKRFIYGLSKKVLISNIMAQVCDQIFTISISNLSTPVAWVGIICYSLQIYFDFSGYSDMAIGLGEMFGFTFMENFNYPYIAKSIQDFWRRWHISLSTWFKEYLYIPLGGNRKGACRTYINLMIVFFATGLWHGASWNFILWGLFHGVFLVLERWKLGKWLESNKYKVINSIYTLLVVGIGWVLFRSENLSYAIGYIKTLFIPTTDNPMYTLGMFMDFEVTFTMIIGIMLSGTVQKICPKWHQQIFNRESIKVYEIIILLPLLFLCIVCLISGAYNPFIYFRF